MRLIIIAIVMAAFSAFAYAEQTEVWVDCWDAGGCEVCGDINYTCRVWNTWTESCDFEDPLPEGSTVTGVEATFYGLECGAISVAPDINGESIGMTSSEDTCSCDECNTWSTSEDFNGGMPGYNYGGTNTLKLNSGMTGQLCLSKVKLTIDYDGEPIPEFGAIAAVVAVVGAGLGYLALRRR